jgi:DNA-binding response OmpR family regulator
LGVSTLLIASDAPTLRAGVVGAIARPDDTTIEVRSGQAVIDAVREDPPDLIVLDMQMGSMGAVAICLELRNDESFGALEHVPVLILLDRRADVFLAKRSGAEGWVVKPLDPLRLRRAATALLSGGTFHDDSFLPISSPKVSADAVAVAAGSTASGS